ncbi:MAG TPA: c-type cytochrome [Gemmatimonadaceae bacterium]|jgi:cytochrome c1|nr:c-type cytochrome [Gemmatimonadaceae bacterium]
MTGCARASWRRIGPLAIGGAALLAAASACRRVQDAAGGRGAPGAPPVLTVAAFAPATPERGRAAIDAYGCGACHMIPGVDGAVGLVGPPLVAWSRRTVIAGELSNTPENLVRWIRYPQLVEPGTAMPNLGVTDRDARAISAYLATLR